MNLLEYQTAAMRTKADQQLILDRLSGFQLHPNAMQLINGSIGLSDEAGEIAACVKCHVEYGKPLDIINLKEEIGDCLWRLSQLADAAHLELEQCAVANINKLKLRYPDKFSDFQAAEENRDRVAERQLLEEPLYYDPGPQLKRGPGPLPEKRYQTGQGFAEPPDEILSNTPLIRDKTISLVMEPTEGTLTVSFGDGLVRDKPLNHSYSRYCKSCNKQPVHETSTSGICPDCAADMRAGRKPFPVN